MSAKLDLKELYYRRDLKIKEMKKIGMSIKEKHINEDITKELKAVGLLKEDIKNLNTLISIMKLS